MLRPVAYVTITKSDGSQTVFNWINYIEISKSYEHLTGTAKVILPKRITDTGLELFSGALPIFERGDNVLIEGGYFPNRYTLFEGFVSKVSARIPVEIDCEDYMYLFKQFKFTYPPPSSITIQKFSKTGKSLKYPKVSSANITLKQLFDGIFHDGDTNDYLTPNGVDYKLADSTMSLGQLRVTEATPADVFDKLRDNYGLFTYMRGKTIYCGFASDAVQTNEAEYVIERVGINMNDLDYQQAKDVKIRVQAVGMLPNGTKVTVNAGDDDGEQRTYHFYNVSDQAMLQKMATERVNQYKYTGFRGTFKTFGEPQLQHGDRCRLTSRVLPERNGVYLVKGTKVVHSIKDGYKQYFELGLKVA